MEQGENFEKLFNKTVRMFDNLKNEPEAGQGMQNLQLSDIESMLREVFPQGLPYAKDVYLNIKQSFSKE